VEVGVELEVEVGVEVEVEVGVEVGVECSRSAEGVCIDLGALALQVSPFWLVVEILRYRER
jgi:hypothetical protein